MSIQGVALSLRDSPHLCPKNIEHEGCCSVTSDSLQPHELQRTRLPCPSLLPFTILHCPSLSSLSWVVYPNSCPLSWWCHPNIPSSVFPFSSYLQSFPASRFFPVSQFFMSAGQNIGASASASVLPKNTQDWSCSPRDSQESSPTPQFKSISSLALSLFYCPALTSIHDYRKNHRFD